jgi:hypothetical protein
MGYHSVTAVMKDSSLTSGGGACTMLLDKMIAGIGKPELLKTLQAGEGG